MAAETVNKWRAEGMPAIMKNGRPTGYRLQDIVQWLVKRRKISVVVTGDEGQTLPAGESPALEEYRRCRAKLADLDLQQRRGELVPINDLKIGLHHIRNRMQSTLERLQQRYGPEAADIFAENLDDIKREIEELGQSSNGDVH